MIADHFAVACNRKKSCEHVQYVYSEIKDYCKYNAKSSSDLLHHNLEYCNYIANRDPNVLWILICSNSRDILEIMCPIRRYKQLEHLTPWMEADIYREMRYREIRRQRNVVNSKIEIAKKNYITRILNENNKNPRKFWKLVNELLNGKRSATEYAQFFDPTTNVKIPFGDEA